MKSISLAILLMFHIIILKTHTQFVNISFYVNNTFTGSIQNGTNNFPYSMISEVFTSNISTMTFNSTMNITIYVTASSESYTMIGFDNSPLNMNFANITIKSNNSINSSLLTIQSCLLFPTIIMAGPTSNNYKLANVTLINFENLNFILNDTGTLKSLFVLQNPFLVYIMNTCIQITSQNYAFMYITTPNLSTQVDFILNNSIIINNNIDGINQNSYYNMFTIQDNEDIGISNVSISNINIIGTALFFIYGNNYWNLNIINITSNSLLQMEFIGYNQQIQSYTLLSNITIQLSIINQTFNSSSPLALFLLNPSGSTIVQNLLVQIDSCESFYPSILAINGIHAGVSNNITLNMISIINSNLQNSSAIGMWLFEICPSSSPLRISNLIISNSTINNIDDFYLIYIAPVSVDIQFSNFTIQDVIVIALDMFQLINIASPLQNVTLYLQNTIFLNNSISSLSRISMTVSNIQMFQIPQNMNMYISNLTLSNEISSEISYIYLNGDDGDLVMINELNISNCNFETSEIIYIIARDTYISSLTMINNTFYASGFLNLQNNGQTLVTSYIINSIFSNNNYTNSFVVTINFELIKPPINNSSFYFTNNIITNNILNQTNFITLNNVAFMFIDNNNWTNLTLYTQSFLILHQISGTMPYFSVKNNWTNYLIQKFLLVEINPNIIETMYQISYINNSLGYIQRVSQNIFQNISACNVSVIFSSTQSEDIGNYLCIDNNNLIFLTLCSLPDAIILLNGMGRVAFSSNLVDDINGDNNIISLIDNEGSFFNFSENIISNFSQTIVINIQINTITYFGYIANIIQNIVTIQPLIQISALVNSGCIELSNNEFTNITLYANPQSFSGIYLIYMLINNAENVLIYPFLISWTTIYMDIIIANNTFENISLSTNQTHIVQFVNSLLYLNIPNDSLILTNNIYNNISIIKSNLICIFANNVVLLNETIENISSYHNFGVLYFLADNI